MSIDLDVGHILTLEYRIALFDRAHAYMVCYNDMFMETEQSETREILLTHLREICALDTEISSRVKAGEIANGTYDPNGLEILGRRLRKQLAFARNLGDASHPTEPAALQLIVDCKRAGLQ